MSVLSPRQKLVEGSYFRPFPLSRAIIEADFVTVPPNIGLCQNVDNGIAQASTRGRTLSGKAASVHESSGWFVPRDIRHVMNLLLLGACRLTGCVNEDKANAKVAA